MTDTAALAAWLRQQLDDDARIARAAGDDEWSVQQHPSETVAVYDSHGSAVVYDEGAPTEEQAAHIARHDPARVLRAVEAKRKIIDEWLENHDAADAEACPNDWNGGIDKLGYFVLPLLAAEYADRPGYREEWKP